jgi:hypothetical protein
MRDDENACGWTACWKGVGRVVGRGVRGGFFLEGGRFLNVWFFLEN